MNRLYTYNITADYLRVEDTSVSLYDRDVSGFTGHEHLSAFNLINMNGRYVVYPEWPCYFGNPVVSRMLSPDNYIQAPDFSQSFNRYPYCMNNPINLVDKSGYYWLDYDYDYDYDWEDPPDPTYWGGWKTGIEVIASFDDNYTTREIDYDWNDFYEDYLYEDFQGQGSGNYAWAGVLAFAGKLALADGTLPIGDAIGGAVVLSYLTYVLAEKMTSEISRIERKVNTTRGFTYELRVNNSGLYTNVRGVPVQMNAGDVWKYGKTTSMYRYSGPELDHMIPGGVHRVDIFSGNDVEIKIQEKIMIYGYFFQHGHLPPGNKIFR